MDSQPQHLQPEQLHSTTEAAAMLGVVKATLRSRKSRHKDVLVEDIHWKQQDGGTYWTTAGLLAVAERTATPQAKALLAQTAKLCHAQAAPTVEVHPKMQELDKTPEPAQRDTALPSIVQHSSIKNRLLVAASVVVAFVLGGSVVWVSRPNATVAASDSGTSDRVALQLNSPVAERDRAIDRSLTLAAQQQDAIDTARRDYLLAQANHAHKTTGISVNEWLTRYLNKQSKALEASTTRNSGSAQQVANTRSTLGETRATLLALQSNKMPTVSYSLIAASLAQSLHQIPRQSYIKEASR